MTVTEINTNIRSTTVTQRVGLLHLTDVVDFNERVVRFGARLTF